MASNYDQFTANEAALDLDALTPDRVEDINFIPFTPIPLNSKKDVLDKWFESTRYIETDLHHLLEMSNQQFWCQAIFDDSLHECITGFLRHVPRLEFPLNENKYSKEVEERLSSLGRLFLLTCLRFSNYSEGDNDLIPKSEFGEVLYENLIFDIPRLVDLCTVYGSSNKILVEQIIRVVFSAQPKYHDDVKCFAETLPLLLDSICKDFSLTEDMEMPRKISQNGNHSHQAKDTFTELISIVYESFNSLRMLFEIHPPTLQSFFSPTILSCLSEFYEVFCDHLHKGTGEMEVVSEQLSRTFCLSRYSVLQVFRQIFYHSTLKSMFEDPNHLEEIVEGYLTTLQLVLGEGRFLADYFHYFSIQEDVDMIEQAGLKIDDVRLDCIMDAINTAMEFYVPHFSDDDESSDGDESDCDGDDSDCDGCLGAVGGVSSKGTLLGDEEFTKILSIQELLPHLGMGFIKKCLDYYKGNSEAIISAILEDNLPPSLKSVDQSFKLEDDIDHYHILQPNASSSMDERKNVFDGDEFDAFSNNIDLKKVLYGKKSTGGKLALPDFSLKEKVKMLSQMVSDDEDDAMYQDEYDDTYDDCNLGEIDTDFVDELTTKGQFMVKPLNGTSTRMSQEVEEEDDNDNDPKPSRNPSSFLEDPAVLRERAAQKSHNPKSFHLKKNYPQNQGNYRGAGARHHPRGTNSEGGNQEQQHFSNPNNRGKTRSSKANHNRRDLAAKKQRF